MHASAGLLLSQVVDSSQLWRKLPASLAHIGLVYVLPSFCLHKFCIMLCPSKYVLNACLVKLLTSLSLLLQKLLCQLEWLCRPTCEPCSQLSHLCMNLSPLLPLRQFWTFLHKSSMRSQSQNSQSDFVAIVATNCSFQIRAC